MDQNEVANNSINSDLIRGHIDTIILKALQAGDRYGYDIIKEIEHKSDGQYVIKQPTLYSCLKRLEVQGFVKSYWGSKSIGGRKKYFTLTDLGRELFIKNKTDWDYSRDVINKLISDDDYSTVSYEDVNIENTEEDFAENIEQSQEDGEITTEVCEEEQTNEINEQVVDTEEVAEEDDDEDIDEDEVDDFEDDDDELSDDNEEESYIREEELDEQYADDESAITSIIEDSSNNESIVCDSLNNEDELDLTSDEVACEDNSLQDEHDDFSDSTTQFFQEQVVKELDIDSTNNNATISDFDDAIPLSSSELSYSLEDSRFSAEENSDAINEFYEENSRESYIDSANTTEYVANDDIIDVGNYFADIDIEDNEEVASAVAAENTQQNIEDDTPTQKFFPSRKIIRTFDNKEETVFYSYNRPMSNIDESSAVIDKEYRSVIAKLIDANIVHSKPQNDAVNEPNANKQAYDYQNNNEPTTPNLEQLEDKKAQAQIESETGEKFDIRTHNHNTIKLYNNKHYYYSNQLKLMQSGILFGIMLVEIVLCFYFIEILHNNLIVSNFNLIMYIVAVVLAATFPISAFFAASTDYYKRKRINYSGKSNAFFAVASTILLLLIIFFINVYGGLLISDISNYLSTLILPAALSSNVITNTIIFHILYKSGKYNLDN